MSKLNKLLELLLAYATVTAVVACSSGDESVTVATKTVPLRRVVVSYMMAENSLSSAALDDLREMRAGATDIPSDCKLAVFFDNSDSANPPQILALDSDGESAVYEYPEDVCSTDSATLQQALSIIVEAFPADEYALILWSHGSGWLPSSQRRTIGIDNGANTTSNTGEEMEIQTLRRVLENTGITWQYIFYDACFMQCVEAAYELRNVTRWSIGSPAEIPGYGANYTVMMPYFFEATDFARDIPEQYYKLYSDNYGVLVSAIQSSQLDNLAQATAEALVPLDDFPADGIQKYCTYATATSWKPEYYDMGSCIYHWAGDAGYASWQTAMERAVPYRFYSDTWLTSYSSVFTAQMTDAEHYSGMSMYLPAQGRDNDNTAWRTYEWYTAAGFLLDK